MRKQFAFIYPVTRPLDGQNKIGGQLYDHVADLIVKGVASISRAGGKLSDKCRLTISEILLEGQDLFGSIDNVESIENIKAACVNHAQQLFSVPRSDNDEYEEPLIAAPTLAMAFTNL